MCYNNGVHLTPLGCTLGIWGINNMAPSSSGPGRLVLIQKIAGSTPAGVTRNKKKTLRVLFLFLISDGRRSRLAGSLVVGDEKNPKFILDFLRRRPTI